MTIITLKTVCSSQQLSDQLNQGLSRENNNIFKNPSLAFIRSVNYADRCLRENHESDYIPWAGPTGSRIPIM